MIASKPKRVKEEPAPTVDSLRWASLDVASRVSGVAFWDGRALRSTCAVYGVRWKAWRPVIEQLDAVVIEAGFAGPNRKTGQVLAEARGRVLGFCDVVGAVVLGELAPAAWRRQVGLPTSGTRELQKQAAVAQCRWLATADRPRAVSRWDAVRFPHRLTQTSEDECEAALLGLAWLDSQGMIVP